NKRWFILRKNGELCYYSSEKEESGPPRGKLFLKNGARFVCLNNEENSNLTIIIVKVDIEKGKNCWHLRQNSTNLNEWLVEFKNTFATTRLDLVINLLNAFETIVSQGPYVLRLLQNQDLRNSNQIQDHILLNELIELQAEIEILEKKHKYLFSEISIEDKKME